MGIIQMFSNKDKFYSKNNIYNEKKNNFLFEIIDIVDLDGQASPIILPISE